MEKLSIKSTPRFQGWGKPFHFRVTQRLECKMTFIRMHVLSIQWLVFGARAVINWSTDLATSLYGNKTEKMYACVFMRLYVFVSRPNRRTDRAETLPPIFARISAGFWAFLRNFSERWNSCKKCGCGLTCHEKSVIWILISFLHLINFRDLGIFGHNESI